MSEQKPAPESAPPESGGKWSELDELQREIERRIKDNQRFLDGFLDEDYQEEEGDSDEGADGSDDEFEEL